MSRCWTGNVLPMSATSVAWKSTFQDIPIPSIPQIGPLNKEGMMEVSWMTSTLPLFMRTCLNLVRTSWAALSQVLWRLHGTEGVLHTGVVDTFWIACWFLYVFNCFCICSYCSWEGSLKRVFSVKPCKPHFSGVSFVPCSALQAEQLRCSWTKELAHKGDVNCVAWGPQTQPAP